MTSKLPVLLLCALASSVATAAGSTFIGYFTPGNWTFENSNSDGSILSFDSFALSFIGGNNNSDEPGSTIVKITAPSAGTVSFNWSYSTLDVDGPGPDPFGYHVAGNFFQLTDSGGGNSQNGSFSFPVAFGEFMGFQINTSDNSLGRADSTISNFSFTPSETEVPFGVDSTLGLGLLGAAAAFKFRRRRKA